MYELLISTHLNRTTCSPNTNDKLQGKKWQVQSQIQIYSNLWQVQSKFTGMYSIEQNSPNDRSLKRTVNLPQALIQTITGSQQSLVQNVHCNELNRHQLNV